MHYFIVNLIAHVSLVVFTVVLMCYFTRRNRKHENKHAIGYFLPVFLAVAAFIFGYFYAGPRLLDINSVLNANYYSLAGTVSEVSPLKNYFVIDGVYYYMNPLRNNLEVGDSVRIKDTPYSHYTVEITKDICGKRGTE